jgi:PRC-barrel domain protein
MVKLAATTLIFSLATTMASAQTPQPPPPPVVQAVGPAQILPSIPVNARTVTHWLSQGVYDPSDSKIGEIVDVLVDKDGRMVALIVGVGGFLGIGEKDVAFPVNAVQFKTKADNKWYPVMNTTKDALKNAPGYKFDRTSMAWIPNNAAATTGASPPANPRPNAR